MLLRSRSRYDPCPLHAKTPEELVSARVFPAPFDMAETRHPDGSDLDNRHRFGARARHAGDSPTAACTADIRALARSLRSGLQARLYQAWVCYRKASAKGSSEIAARSPGVVVMGAVVAPTRARAFPVIYIQRRGSGMALVYATESSRDDQQSAQRSASGQFLPLGARR
jgi:hypothetical protein